MLRVVLRAVTRGLVPAAAFAALSVVLLAAGARSWLPLPVRGPVAEGAWTARSRALFVPTGFYPAEFDTGTERHFSWAGRSAALDFSALNRSIAYQVTLEVRGGRPAGTSGPTVRVLVDGALRLTTVVPNETSTLTFEIPRADRSGAAVTLESDPLYVPGGGDPRQLGVIVDDVAVKPVNGMFRPTAGAFLLCLLATLAAVWGVAWTGLRGWPFSAAAAGVSTGFVWLLLKDAAFAGAFPERLLHVALIVAAIGGLVGLARRRWPTVGGVPEWSAAAGLVLAISAVKLALFWHPLAQVGDAIFQVHRAELVHAGNYFFTSVTPRPFFEFPYPVALYVSAQPFWSFFPTELDLARLLRAMSILADGMAGIGLYLALMRQWNDRRTALFVAALWPFAQAPFEALTNANLTNLFGQGVFGAALAGVAWAAAAGATSWIAWIVIATLFVIAFLSHFGTLTVGLVMLGVVAIALIGLGRGPIRRAGLLLCAATLAAAAVAWVTYYSHPSFREVYAKTFADVRAGPRDDSSKMVAAPSVKLQRWWNGIGDDYGRPGVLVLATAVAGLVLAFRRRPAGGATLVVASWLAAWVGLSALGILTAITLRANLAAAPAFVYFCAIALGALNRHSRAGLAASFVVYAALAWSGWQIALRCLDLAGG